MYGPFYYFALLLNTVKKEKLGIILTHDSSLNTLFFSQRQCSFNLCQFCALIWQELHMFALITFWGHMRS